MVDRPAVDILADDSCLWNPGELDGVVSNGEGAGMDFLSVRGHPKALDKADHEEQQDCQVVKHGLAQNDISLQDYANEWHQHCGIVIGSILPCLLCLTICKKCISIREAGLDWHLPGPWAFLPSC